MLKKILSVLLSAIMIFGVFTIVPFHAFAEMSGQCGDDVYWTLSDDGMLTISGNGRMSDYGGLYTWFKTPWEDIRDEISIVVIEKGVTYIGASSFYMCNNLASVSIANTVTEIGDYSFRNCIGLKNISIPNSVTSIGKGVFSASGLTEISIPNSVIDIGGSTFSSCKNLTTIDLPDSVTSINDNLFSDCSNLTNITLPDTISYIGFASFRSCISLKSIVLPDSVDRINYGTFESCSALESVVLGKSVWEISEKAFNDCKNLTSIVIPASLTRIENGAFEGCDSLFDVYYSGSRSDWSDVDIGGENDELLNSNIYYDFTGSDSFKFYTYFINSDEWQNVSCSFWNSNSQNESQTNIMEPCGKFEGFELYRYYVDTEYNMIVFNGKKDGADVHTKSEGVGIQRGKAYHPGIKAWLDIFNIETYHEINSDPDNTRYFHFKKNEEIEDLVFSQPSTEYNPRLAHFLACMARSAYTSNLVKANYKELGFDKDSIIQEHYDVEDKISGFNIGKKELDNGKVLILVTIRGTTGSLDQPEWRDSDFNTALRESGLSSSVGVHSGFEDCEIVLFERLKEYLGGSISKQNTTYIITGHSLGGAVGNLLAMRLYNEGVSNQDVFDYNFASPLVAAGPEDASVWNDNGVHNNIISVNNWFDYVPSWPGINNYSQVQYDDYEKKGWMNFKRFGVSYWFDNGFMNYGDAHNICSYIDYLEKLNDKSHFRDTEYFIDIVSAHCPVDVVIYDKKGNPIAGTINNEPYYYGYEPGEKAVILVNGDKKDFYILNNDPYEVHLTGTDEGEMEYSVSSVNTTSGVTLSKKWFESVPLTTGKQMLGKTVNILDEETKTITQEEKLLLMDDQGNTNTEILANGEETDYTVKYILGDADNSGSIDIIDATFIQRKLADIATPYTDEILHQGDADGSGELDVIDVTMIQRHLVDLKTPYLVGADVV